LFSVGGVKTSIPLRRNGKWYAKWAQQLVQEESVRELDAILGSLVQEFRKILSGPGGAGSVSAGGELTTAWDLRIDRLLQKALATAYPGLPIVSEESTPLLLESVRGDYLVVDPVDGTKALAAGSPLFAVCVARIAGDSVVEAVVDFPRLGFRMSAARGGGVALHGSLPDSLARLTGVVCSPGISTDIERLMRGAGSSAPVTGVPTSSLKMGLIAANRAEAACYLHTGGRPAALWDYAAGALLVRESGGAVTDLQGGSLIDPVLPWTTGWIAAASESRLGPIGAAARALAGA
jgi:myo-inositol-1(or 4)-monophosphatase